jgi:2',3'-cyclic-nucleotide 2'-phosphodiesterase (5'-nucleotidase family)
MKHRLRRPLLAAAASGLWAVTLLTGCQSAAYTITQIEGQRIPVSARYDADPDSAALAILAPYKHRVDSIMSPLVGHSARVMDRHRPESLLSNLVADILRQGSQPLTGQTADVAVTNMGGLRSNLPEGEITYGNIFEITPFENYFGLITMKGSELRELFQDIARVHGEGLSGARLVISSEGELISAEVGGQPIADDRDYQVATIDYLAEGNDHMDTFIRIPDERKKLYPGRTLRGLFLEYVMRKERAHELVDSKMDGRIQVKE